MTELKHRAPPDLAQHYDTLLPLLREVIARDSLTADQLNTLLRRYPRPGGGLYGRSDLIHAYRALAASGALPPHDAAIIERLRRKPTRTASGVTVVTILTKPFPCPGECIFCPADVRMPKSYLVNEPGAQRAAQNGFDPYLQTYTRLLTYRSNGHPTDKIELIILGGTWSFYPESYQIWFIRRAFDALHDFGAGLDRRTQVEAALLAGSQLHPQRLTVSETVDGSTPGRTYNQVVQDIYRDELRRARAVARAADAGQRPRSPLDEYATWDELEAAHRANETAACRCVGLVVETRPDHISAAEVLRIRRLGCTKVQIGFQSLSDEVLRLNRRGHDTAATRHAVALLRRAGFKIHAHWMPNLYGSTPQRDIDDYRRLFDDPALRPDELKIYPCSLIESAELMQRYQDGSWRPYTHDELLAVLKACVLDTPEYCRLTRIVRDIPSTDIVDGNRSTNFRQIVEDALRAEGRRSADIRAREIRSAPVSPDALTQDELWYDTAAGREVFLQYITRERALAAFLRLALPTGAPLTPELDGAALVREVHVYGQAVEIGAAAAGRAQHAGLGTRLLERAAEIARAQGYARLAVISAVGTRAYYRARGFTDGPLYQHHPL